MPRCEVLVSRMTGQLGIDIVENGVLVGGVEIHFAGDDVPHLGVDGEFDVAVDAVRRRDVVDDAVVLGLVLQNGNGKENIGNAQDDDQDREGQQHL